MVHEVLVPSADPMTRAPGDKNLTSDDTTYFEAKVRESIERFGTEEGLRRVIEANPEWEKRIAEQFPTQGVAPRDGKRRTKAPRKTPDARHE